MFMNRKEKNYKEIGDERYNWYRNKIKIADKENIKLEEEE